MHRLSLFFLLIIVPVFTGAQKILPDTVLMDFIADSLLPVNHISLSKITDSRNENPHFIRYATKNKFILLPVDIEFYLTEPLTEAVAKGFGSESEHRFNYQLDIKKFEVESRKGRFSNSLYLTADIPVYEIVDDSAEFLGTLYYDYPYKPAARKEPDSVSTMNIMSEWHRDFKLDLLSIHAVTDESTQDLASNFIPDPDVKSSYLNIMTGYFAGYQWWGFQAEAFFTRPETGNKYTFSSGIIRYQNNPDYESFALGKNSGHYLFRKGKNFVFDVDLNMLMGFCKWKDVEKHKPALYQLFDVGLSSVQSIGYNPVNGAGISARLGLIENVSYVIGKKVKLQGGLFLGLGFKI